MNSFELNAKGFGSDNHSGAHPEILKALSECNRGHVPSYGTDEITQHVAHRLQSLFAAPCEVFFVFNGTAANVLALTALTKSFNSIICSDVSHLNNDECNAPEFFTGCKLKAVTSHAGKITVAEIENEMIRLGDQHYPQPGAISITQPTEYGTLYSAEEIKTICDFAHCHGMRVHVDGARLVNAVTALETDFASLITRTGVDVVSFGGTKNGLVFGEAVIFLNPEVAKDFKYLRKQFLQLPSKSRFIAAQFHRFFENDLWREISSHSIRMARLLESKLREIPEVKITQKVESNTVFAILPREWIKPLREKHFFYIWNQNTREVRLVTSFDTSPSDIESLVNSMRHLSLNPVNR